MKSIQYAWLVCRALFELARVDATYAMGGFADIRRQLARYAVANATATREKETMVCDAVALASALYWKPVRCLKRSVCAVRLLRRHGLAAQLVIGYRPVPFLSHAWVEIDGRVVNDSPEYPKQLRVLLTT